ncbi:DUF6039 family protein [Micromonospora sp. NPDC018662]|uniref:DUF6039 family protein n=1 Tax=Micromonospora sp. NPDC018662 TaxID=3364238 RepID=UPI0037A59055
MTSMITRSVTAAHQTGQPTDRLLHSANAGVLVERVAQVAAGRGTDARAALRDMTSAVNEAGVATAMVFEETFGTRDRIHVLLHLRSLSDYDALLAPGGHDVSNGLFGAAVSGRDRARWDALFVPGGVRDTALLPHRFGMFGTATEAMAADPRMAPLVERDGLPVFDVQPAVAQTAVPADQILDSSTAGALMWRHVQFDYRYRAEARVFARTIAETMNLNMRGHATVLLYEELFGTMDRVHFLVHLRSLDVMYELMGLDARTDPDAPRASFLKDWVSLEKGGGSWDQMIVQGGTRDCALSPQNWT